MLPRFTFIIFLIMVNVGCHQPIDSVVIMTYNIRYPSPNDGVDIWDNRKAEVVDLLKYYDPMIFGIQEGLKNQLDYLDQRMGSYARIGVGRDDGKDKGEYTAIYYNTDHFSVIEESTFWLSETPDRPSVGWDAAMERICTYGIFENKNSGRRLLILNAHYDHIGATARENSSKLIVKKINEINKADYPVILMGDFNAEPESQPITIFATTLDDGAQVSQKDMYGPAGTFTGFDLGIIADKRLDCIFVKDLNVIRYRHIDDKRKDNGYVSDHLPVLIEFQ